MTRLQAFISVSFFLSIIACKSVEARKIPETNAATKKTGEELVEEFELPPPEKPSTHYSGLSESLIPEGDEGLTPRSKKARCPTLDQINEIKTLLDEIGEGTYDLVKEDLNTLRVTRQRKDRVAIASCCNQLEQLVQDISTLNQDRDEVQSKIGYIKKLSLELCPVE